MNRKEERLSEMILSYLRRHPNAGDTLEGITKWWLGLERIDTSADEVADALECLRQKGIIKVHRSTDGSTLYRIRNTDDKMAEKDKGSATK